MAILSLNLEHIKEKNYVIFYCVSVLIGMNGEGDGHNMGVKEILAAAKADN